METVQTLSQSFNDSSWGFALNIATVLIMYGPFYLANTGAMLFGKWIPDRLGFDSVVIDRGRTLGDGFRILGDGKTWNGFFGGAFFSGILAILSHNFFGGRSESGSRPFIDPTLWASQNDWFWIGNEWGAAFTMGFTLGIACMSGDLIGSFFKRRKGHKREGSESSQAPILDTMTFAVTIFLASFILFDGQIITSPDLVDEILALLVLTPVIHRAANIFGFKLGLKSVPY